MHVSPIKQVMYFFGSDTHAFLPQSCHLHAALAVGFSSRRRKSMIIPSLQLQIAFHAGLVERDVDYRP